MQSPVSMQVDAQRRDASGPLPLRRISITPETTTCAGAVTPAGVLTGQTSTHFPQRVHASMMSSTRPFNASSKKLLMGHAVWALIGLVYAPQVLRQRYAREDQSCLVRAPYFRGRAAWCILVLTDISARTVRSAHATPQRAKGDASMLTQAKPSDLGSRVPFDADRLDRLMDEADLDALVATSKHNVQYLLGGHRAFFFDYMDAMGLSRYLPIMIYVKGVPEKAAFFGHRLEGFQREIKPFWTPEQQTN